MKDVLKISILLILALSNGALFAQTNRYLNLNRDTLDHYCPVKILDLEINRVDHHPLGR